MLRSSISLYFSTIKDYFHHHGIKLHPTDIKDTLRFPVQVSDELYALQLEDIQEIFRVSKHKMKSFYLALISTGARPVELLQVRKSDIDTTGKDGKSRFMPNLQKEELSVQSG